jgi:hypothetical protein
MIDWMISLFFLLGGAPNNHLPLNESAPQNEVQQPSDVGGMRS